MLKLVVTISNSTDMKKSVTIQMPCEEQRLRNPFLFLGLEYKDLEGKQTKIEKIKIIPDCNYRGDLEQVLNKYIEKTNTTGRNTSYNKIEEVYRLLENKTNEELAKIEQILKFKKFNICDIDDVIKLIKTEKKYEYYPNINTLEGFAQEKMKKEFPKDLWLQNYLDFHKLGIDIANKTSCYYTDNGALLVSKPNTQQRKRHPIYRTKKNRNIEEDLEI